MRVSAETILPKDLVEVIGTGECVLFLGAGVHAPPPDGSGYAYAESERPPGVDELAEKLADVCEFTRSFPREKYPKEYPLSLARVALFADTPTGGGRHRLVERLGSFVQEGKQPSPALCALAQMPFKVIVTTNFDTLFETALVRCNKAPVRLVYNPDPGRPTEDVTKEPTADRPIVFKIHGDFERPESIVITDEDYITFVQRMGESDRYHPVPLTVREKMRKWPTLFVGYSLRDYNLRLLFRTLRWRIDEARFPLSFSVDRGPDPLIYQVWEHEHNYVRFVVQDLWKFVPQVAEFLGLQMSGKAGRT
jgi:hypothetical protein